MIVNMLIVPILSPKLEEYYFIKRYRDQEGVITLCCDSVFILQRSSCIRDFGGRQIIAIILLILKYNHCRIRRE